MSKLGKKPIMIPGGTEVIINDLIKTKGPKGELQMVKPSGFSFDLNQENNVINVTPEDKVLKQKNGSALWGLYHSLLSNMIEGVSRGFEKKLEFEGVGYRAILKGTDLELQMGFTHPVLIQAPEGISIKVEKNKIVVYGIDKQMVGQIAAKIRAVKPPEPYKGKGIRYEGEVIIRKAGKKAATTAG